MKRNPKLTLSGSAPPVSEAVPPAAPGEYARDPKGGIFEDLDAFPGTYVLNVYDAAGRRIGVLELLANRVDDELCEDLERWYERQSPRPALV